MMRFIVIAIALSSVAAADVSVVLQSHADLERNELRLSDLAIFRGNRRDIEVLGSMMLPVKGKVGETVQYRRNDVAKCIAFKHPELMRGIQFDGAEQVLLTRRGEPLPVMAYTRAAKSELDEKLTQFSGTIKTELDGNYREVMIPRGRLELRTQAQINSVRSNIKVWVDIYVDGQHYTSIPVAFKVYWPQQALALTSPTKAKSSITEGMLSRVAINAAEIAGVLVTSPQQLQAKRLRHEMEAGAVVRLEDLEEMPLIASGDDIDVIAQVGGIVVQTKAVAERDGFMGQLIKTRLSKSQENLLVKVIGEGRAIVSTNQLH